MLDYNQLLNRIERKLKELYHSNRAFEEVKIVLDKWEKEKFDVNDEVNEKTVFMITYGDSIYYKDTKGINTLHKFAKKYLKESITNVHLLPMFEYTSDDGFSVVDFRKVDPQLGDFNDIKALGQDFNLMYDFVANHVSKSSNYFKGYLNGEERYKDFFVEYDEEADYSKFVRPRTSPLFHEYENNHRVITTFSEDQIDLNVKNPKVLAELTDILLYYAHNGASAIRLDAIGFLWKESGTTSLHLNETHEIVKLWRLILEYYKKNTLIITETNVPHKENISYFGNEDEAHMVYQFPLPPLVLHSFVSGDATKLSDWAKTINLESEKITYFNFLSSHDGIGLRPTEGILNDEERAQLAQRVLENGGKISYKSNADGSQSIYELNINYHDALVNNDYSEGLQIKQILAANAVLFSIIGAPAIYYNTLLGSRNDYKGYEASGINRRINREKYEYDYLVSELESDERRAKIFSGIKDIISEKKKHSALNPYARQKVLEVQKEVFALERFNKDTEEKLLVFINVSNTVQEVPEYDVVLQPFEYLYKQP